MFNVAVYYKIALVIQIECTCTFYTVVLLFYLFFKLQLTILQQTLEIKVTLSFLSDSSTKMASEYVLL